MRDGFMAWIAAMVVQAVVFALAALPAAGRLRRQRLRPARCDGRRGHPDLSGIWQVMNTAAWDIRDHSAQKGVPAGQGVVEGNEIHTCRRRRRKKTNYENRATADPETKCYLPGVRASPHALSFQIAQSSKRSRSSTSRPRRSQHLHGSPHIKGPSTGGWGLAWPLREYAGRRRHHFNEETWLADRIPAGELSPGRALYTRRSRPDQLRSHHRRSEDVFQAVEDEHAPVPSQREERSNPGIRMLFVLKCLPRRWLR